MEIMEMSERNRVYFLEEHDEKLNCNAFEEGARMEQI